MGVCWWVTVRWRYFSDVIALAVSLTRKADFLDGAGLSNAVWMPPGGAVLELTHSSCGVHCGDYFRPISELSGLKHVAMAFPGEEEVADEGGQGGMSQAMLRRLVGCRDANAEEERDGRREKGVRKGRSEGVEGREGEGRGGG